MRYLLFVALIFCSAEAISNPPPQSRYAGVCARRCRSSSSSIVEATLVDPIQRKRTHERVYIYSAVNPVIVCQCHSAPVRHRTRAERETTASLARSCDTNCRAGIRLYPDVLIVDARGRERRESISILQYDSPIGCICTGIPVLPPPPEPPRRHPER